MQKPTDDRRVVHTHLREDQRDIDRMNKIRFSALAQLSLVQTLGCIECFADQLGVVFRIDI